jgi:hypothetical protein
MTPIPELLAAIRNRGARLWLEGDRLRYAAPEGMMTPDLRAHLSAQKEEIVRYLKGLTAAAPAAVAAGPLNARRSGEPLPLSFAQERLWFLYQLNPRSSLYNIAGGYRFRGPLDLAMLDRSLGEIVRRHDSLRTTFVSREGSPRQIIHAEVPPILAITDLRGMFSRAPAEEVRRLFDEEARQPFDLGQPPLIRVRVWRLDDEDHVVLATMHHIISDGWSLGVLIRELCAFYHAFHQGAQCPLPKPRMQYTDFAQWQREYFTGAVLQEQMDYWRRQLQNLPEPLSLAWDRASRRGRTLEGRTQLFRMEKALLDRLKVLSLREGTSLFVTLLAAFQALLHGKTGQTDIAVGSPIANRNRQEFEGLIGFFVNTLVLRTDLSGDPTFEALLRRVHTVALGAYAHQDLPFDRLVQELNPDRDPGHSPLFRVMFVLQNVPLPDPNLPSIAAERWDVSLDTAKFDLLVSLVERRQCLEGTVEYSTDLFEAATIAELIDEFQAVVECIAVDPQRRLSTLPMSGPADQDAVAPAGAAPGRGKGQVRADRSIELRELLVSMRERGVRLWLKDDRLHYSAPEGVLTPALREELRERKPEVMAFLREAAPPEVDSSGARPGNRKRTPRPGGEAKRDGGRQLLVDQ